MAKRINIERSESISPVFNRIISEINATEIPTAYIEKITVTFVDGNVVELTGDEITHPVPINRKSNWNELQRKFKAVQEVKVFVKTAQLEREINAQIMKRLGKYFSL